MIFRTMSQGDLAAVLDWAADEGWNPGQDDAAAFLATDPRGFFLAEVDGTPAAAISVVNHCARFAFLGLYLCRPAFRGRGIGHALWRHALGHAGGRSIGLDGVAAQQGNYARSGFAATGATLRLQGVLRADALPPQGAGPLREAATLRDARPGDLPALAALDLAANGHERAAFVAAWTGAAPGRATLVLDGAAGPRGFATVRACRAGCKIGPVVAPGPDAALALIGAAAARMAARVAAAPVILDVPRANLPLRGALAGLGFAETFRTARMYRGPAPATGSTLQAVATMELG